MGLKNRDAQCDKNSYFWAKKKTSVVIENFDTVLVFFFKFIFRFFPPGDLDVQSCRKISRYKNRRALLMNSFLRYNPLLIAFFERKETRRCPQYIHSVTFCRFLTLPWLLAIPSVPQRKPSPVTSGAHSSFHHLMIIEDMRSAGNQKPFSPKRQWSDYSEAHSTKNVKIWLLTKRGDCKLC